MKAARDSLFSALQADPLASVRMDAMADLAFGSLTVDFTQAEGGHLAILDNAALELDLTDPLQRQFGDYELLELIGEGGMGVVYRARQRSLDRDVAVKLLAAGPWASKNFVERFRLEAQNAARMQHPNIVAIYEVGTAEELHFFSMRLVRGGSLASMLRHDGKFAPRQAASLVRVVAEAVDYAHRLGVLHLDLKPANVLIDEGGVPHVADFGLARRLDTSLAADNDEVSGTPSYMAPEQAQVRSQKITAATDIYGIGAILYELVTGQPPFLAESPQATLKLVIAGDLRAPREHVPELPGDLDAIIRKCMARESTARYPTARALADDLAAFREGRAVKARPLNAMQRAGRWARREPRVAITAVFAFAALLAGLATTTQQWRRAEAQRHLAQEQTELARENEATSHERLWEGRRETALRLQNDGKGFDALPPLVSNIEEQEKAGRPDAIERREVGMILHRGVTLIDRMIIADGQPTSAALSADGSLLAVGLNDVSVRWYDTATLSERGRVDLSDLPTSDGAAHSPMLLRFIDNHRLLVTLEWYSYIISPSYDDTLLVDMDSGRAITPSASDDVTQTEFSTDGRYALVFDHDGTGRFWQVEPWRLLSDAAISNHGRATVTPWLIGRDARYALHFRYSMTGITMSDPRRALAMHSIPELADRRFTAWQESHDGRHVALGDDEGHVFLLDTAAQKTIEVATSKGSEVTWLAFSEDDEWFAAARREGDAYAFDIRGNPLQSGQLQHDFEPHYVAISHARSLLLVAGAGDSALWRMPEQGIDGGDSEATRIETNASHSAHAGLYWAGESMQAGLLATADMDGEVRLWRLPISEELDARAANLLPGDLHFDGKQVADVDYNQVRALSLDRRTPSPWLNLPQPAAFAELAQGGKSLVAISDGKLFEFDLATQQLRFPPVQLPGTPINATIDSNGEHIALAFGENQSDGYKERIRVFDAADGGVHSGSAIVRGPLRQFEFAAHDTQLMTNGPLDGATEIFDATTLEQRAVYRHDSENPVIWASYTGDGTRLWLAARSSDESSPPGGELLKWNPSTNTIEQHRVLPGAWPVGVSVLGDKPLFATRDSLEMDPGGPAALPALRLHGGEVTTVFAVTPDHTLIANPYGRSVQLYDSATLQRVGSPLPVTLRVLDAVMRLTFDPSGSRLLGRLGTSRRWVLWDARTDTRPLEELRADAQLLAPGPHDGRILRLSSTSERKAMRERDPGAWTAPLPRPAIPAARFVDGWPVPMRDPNASPLMLDLTAFYTLTPYTVRKVTDTVLTDTASLPVGVTPIEGIDYDIRGGIELRQMTADEARNVSANLRVKVSGIRVPHIAIAAFHVLMVTALPIPENAERVYANVRLHYEDGTEAVVPIRTQHDVPGLTDHDRPTPLGWAMTDLAVIGVLRPQLYSNPRLPNPHPERIIASLDLETAPEKWSEPVFIAVTAEPVIAAANSGINRGK